MITFIIPSINRETIKRSVDSLIKQTNKNWNAIIIYDGVDGVDFNDERIVIKKIKKLGGNSQTHGMSGLVRNEGIKLVKTEWIGFLDDDDTLHEDYVKTLFEKYSDKDFVIWRMVYKNGLIIPRLSSNNITFGNVGISFCYKNKFNNLLFNNNRDGEDYDFIISLMSKSLNYVITPEIYYNVNH
jgi:glycosyltransferase involved in cell wall biosynthesis